MREISPEKGEGVKRVGRFSGGHVARRVDAAKMCGVHSALVKKECRQVRQAWDGGQGATALEEQAVPRQNPGR